MELVALMDCNNFFVSCERVFNPCLNGVPVVVLSGNDGCVIARSNEAKALNIPMGIPAFKCKDVFKRYDVVTLSANQVLYSDMSRRVMTLLAQEVDNMNVYSIDEAFFTLSGTSLKDIEEQGAIIANKILKCVGLPVSIGISSTQTLAKIASHIAKKERLQSSRCYLLHDKNDIEHRLSKLCVNEVWGIGRKVSKALAEYNIYTALEFINLPKDWIRSRFSVVGERTWLELRGTSCATIESVDSTKQTITVSRTFSEETNNYAELSEAIATFATNCAIKLRKQKSLCTEVTVYIASNRFNIKRVPYSNSYTIKRPFSTSSTIEITKNAFEALNRIYRNDYSYKQAGVVLSEFTSENSLQLNLFNEVDEGKHKRLMEVVDRINMSSTQSKVSLLSVGFKKPWYPKQLHKTKSFTTKLSDIIVVNCKD